MATSTEFPQYAFVRPASWSLGRPAGQPTVIVMHTTEGSEGRTSAEDGAAYDARRTDGTSTHFFVDQDTTVQCVFTGDRAHAALYNGNSVGIQVEVCGRAGQSAAQWADAASAGTIEQAARLCVALRKRYPGRFPLINLSPAQLRAGEHGFAEHYDATRAWPEDGGDHTDPGPNFSWARLFARITELEEEDDMALSTDDKTWLKGEIAAAANAVKKEIQHWVGDVVTRYNPDGSSVKGTGNDQMSVSAAVAYASRDSGAAVRTARSIDTKLDTVLERLPAAPGA